VNQYISTAWKQLLAVFLLLFVINITTYVVDESERAVVLVMGDPVEDVTQAGLHFKRPWPFSKVRFLEKRMVTYDSEPKAIPTKDKKLIIADLFAFIYVKDGILFLNKVDNMPAAMQRVDTVLYSELRDVLGNIDLSDIVTKSRDGYMEEVQKRSETALAQFGIGIKLALSSRTDFPQQNKAAVYERMKAERERIAGEYRAQGDAEKKRITAETDRDYEIVVSEARKDAEKLRGEGDAEATRIYNEAFGKDPEFFRLYRGLQTAKATLAGSGDTRIILSGTEPHLSALFDKK
jgi:membrane protease subunit HflC